MLFRRTGPEHEAHLLSNRVAIRFRLKVAAAIEPSGRPWVPSATTGVKMPRSLAYRRTLAHYFDTWIAKN
jgi:hypothetical protein